MKQQEKVMLASPEWIELGGRILGDLVQEYGDENFSLSFCYVFIDAPTEIADDSGTASCCYYIENKTVRTHHGKSKDVDVYMQATWELELAGARKVYTPKVIAELEKNPPEPHVDPNMLIEGDYDNRPSWMLEFHNRLAEHTA